MCAEPCYLWPPPFCHVQPESKHSSDPGSVDQTPNEKGDVDPYVGLSLYDPARKDTERQETSKLVNEPDPKWGEKFDFIMASATSILTVDVWDSLGWLEGRLSLKGLTGASCNLNSYLVTQNKIWVLEVKTGLIGLRRVGQKGGHLRVAWCQSGPWKTNGKHSFGKRSPV